MLRSTGGPGCVGGRGESLGVPRLEADKTPARDSGGSQGSLLDHGIHRWVGSGLLTETRNIRKTHFVEIRGKTELKDFSSKNVSQTILELKK